MNDLIYVVRHGETEWNRQGRRQGRSDSALTDLGKGQARAYARWLVNRPEVADLHMRSSPLGRALQTTSIIQASLRLAPERVHVDDVLAEFDYGAWAGLIDSQIDDRYPGQRAAREMDKWNHQVPGGESYASLAERIRPWLHAHRFAGPLVVVAHEIVSRVLRGTYLGLGSDEILKLRHPQTDIYLLSSGSMTRFAVAHDA